MDQPTTPAVPKSVWAKDLVPGDIIVNVGEVLRTTSVGIFTHAAVLSHEWSPTLGTSHERILDIVYHDADTVVLEDDKAQARCLPVRVTVEVFGEGRSSEIMRVLHTPGNRSTYTLPYTFARNERVMIRVD